MNNQPFINCPDCESKIHFDPQALVSGVKFSCPQCPSVSIGLDVSSKDLVQESLQKFGDLKQRLASSKS